MIKTLYVFISFEFKTYEWMFSQQDRNKNLGLLGHGYHANWSCMLYTTTYRFSWYIRYEDLLMTAEQYWSLTLLFIKKHVSIEVRLYRGAYLLVSALWFVFYLIRCCTLWSVFDVNDGDNRLLKVIKEAMCMSLL